MGASPGAGSTRLSRPCSQKSRAPSTPAAAAADPGPLFLGSADLSKAFDRLSASFSLGALRRMGLPEAILRPLSAAWLHQSRWLISGSHTSEHPLPCTALPQKTPRLHSASLPAYRSRIQAQYPACRHSVYLDDRSWASRTAQECVRVGHAWRAESSLWHLSENQGKLKYAAFGGKRHKEQLTSILPDGGAVSDRPKILGTHIQTTRAHSGASAAEAATLNRAYRVIRWTRLLPHPALDRLYFAKATGLAIASAASYSRLPSLANLRPLHGAVYQAADCPTTPLTRLLLGHSADTHHRVGYSVAVQVLNAATLHPHVHRRWTTAQSQGPISVCKRWLARQGWTAVAPWSFEHAAAWLLLSPHPNRPPPPSFTLVHLSIDQWPLVLHCLREAWRASTWSQFLRTGTRAANTLRDIPSTTASAGPARRTHIRAIITDQWFSQARLAFTQHQPVPPWQPEPRPPP